MEKIFGFLVFAVPIFFSPGPNNMLLMASAAQFGIRRTVPHAIGISVGFPILVMVVGLGLGEVFARFPIVKPVMLYGACAYFLYMAYRLLGLKISNMVVKARPMKLFEGALFQVINPKAWVLSFGMISVFVGVGDQRFQDLLWLTVASFLLSPLCSATWMIFGSQVSAFLKRFGYERYLGWLMAALMVSAIVILLV